MFLKFKGEIPKGYTPQSSFPRQETTYWVDISNAGVDGEMIAAIRTVSADASLNNLLWSCKYPDFESLIEEWEIV